MLQSINNRATKISIIENPQNKNCVKRALLLISIQHESRSELGHHIGMVGVLHIGVRIVVFLSVYAATVHVIPYMESLGTLI